MNRIIGGALMVAGTSIGAGMLALPLLTTGHSLGAVLGGCVACWCVMLGAACCMGEVALRYPGPVNLIQMAHDTLGVGAARVAGVFYIAFSYALLSGYMIGGISLPVAPSSVVVGYTVFFGGALWAGAVWMDRLNRVLMGVLILAFVVVCGAILPTLSYAPLHAVVPTVLSWPQVFPLFISAFGFQLLIPSLVHYVGGVRRDLYWVLGIGSLFPLLIYSLWIIVIRLQIPAGALYAMASGPRPMEAMLADLILPAPQLGGGFAAFSLAALLSSFLGVSLSLFDFLANALRGHRWTQHRGVLAACTLLPAMLSAFWLKPYFLAVLRYGSLLSVILLMLYPAWMCVRLRAGWKWTGLGYVLLLFGGVVLLGGGWRPQ